MIVCSHCGLEAQMNDRFCKGCGHRFSVTDGDYSTANLGAGTGLNSGLNSGMGTSFAPSWGTSGTLGALGTGAYAAKSANATDSAFPIDANAATSTSHVAVEVATGDVARPLEVAPVPAPTTQPASIGRLVVRAQNSALGDEREYLLDGQSVTVGRSPSCDIVLDADQLISRRHALLKFEDGRYSLVDLGSSNGTYVNDSEIHEAVPLRSGDNILVGEHELTYSSEPASPSASPTGTYARGAFAAPPPRTDPHLQAVATHSTDDDPTVPGESLEPVENQPTIYIPGPAASTSTDDQAMGDLSALPQAETPIATTDSADGAADEPFALTPVGTVDPTAEETPAASPGVSSDGNPWDSFSPDNLPASLGDLSALAEASQVHDQGVDQPQDLSALTDDLPGVPPTELPTELPTEFPSDGAPAAPPALSTAPAPISAPPSMPKPGDSLIDHISAIQDYTARLRQRTENAELLAAQRQQALVEARERIAAILAEQDRYASADSVADLTPLIEVTRQAVENPRHIDTVTHFSDHAQDILNVLQQRQAQQAAPSEAQHALADLYAWLNRQG